MKHTFRKILVPFAAALALAATPLAAHATGTSSGKGSYTEAGILNGWFRALATTATSGTTDSTHVTLTSATGFGVGDIIQIASAVPANAMVRVTGISGAVLTISPAVTTSASSGAVTRVGYGPPSINIGLFTTCPTAADGTGGTEHSTASTTYNRVPWTQLDSNWNAPSGTPRAMSNANAITFPAPSGAGYPVTVNCVGIWDTSTPATGNLLYFGTLTAAKTLNSGDAAPSFASSALSISED